MTDPHSDERVVELLTQLRDEDFRLDPVPEGLWAQIDDAIAHEVVARPRRWGGARVLVAAAAIVALLLAVTGVVLGRGDGDSVAGSAELVALDASTNPSGRARLVEGDGERALEIEVDALPASENGFYEVWLLSADASRLHALGAIEGSGRFLVPDTIDLAEYPVVDVSLEPVDGDPGHSGASVLRGELR